MGLFWGSRGYIFIRNSIHVRCVRESAVEAFPTPHPGHSEDSAARPPTVIVMIVANIVVIIVNVIVVISMSVIVMFFVIVIVVEPGQPGQPGQPTRTGQPSLWVSCWPGTAPVQLLLRTRGRHGN